MPSIGNTIRSYPPFIQTGSFAKQKGEVDWILLLAFILVLHLSQFQLFYQTMKAWADAYQKLETMSQMTHRDFSPEFEAFGQSMPSPVARIDYGANNQNKKEAEALCIVGRKILSSEEFLKLNCN